MDLIFIKRNNRKLMLLMFDILCFLCTDFIYISATNFIGEQISYENMKKYLINSLVVLVVAIFFRSTFGIYRSIWRYTQAAPCLKMMLSDIFAGAVGVVASYLIGGSKGIWFCTIVMMGFCLASLIARFFYQMLYRKKNVGHNNPANKINVAIVGAGQIGVLLAEELLLNKNSNYNPIAFIDKDKVKQGSNVCGIKVYSDDNSIIDLIKHDLPIQEIFIALPYLDSESANKIYDFYKQTGCKIKIYDTSVKDINDKGDNVRRTLRELQIEDLLFRDQIDISDERTLEYYRNKTVLVTGGGGSIGSEICRQLSLCNPKKVVIFDIYENNAYELNQELKRNTSNKFEIVVEIGSVRDEERLDEIFKKHKPDVVFHAAAHKHVPLMEDCASEAIKNNILGTYNTANAAEKYGVNKFILISTDKAVNPTNIMGASKRLCEMIVQSRVDSKTSFASVRFGNVLGSNGSVIPLFRKQIEMGGPITITDKRIIRYFMTIPEASQLVIQAGSIAKNGELFVLDMGKPVKIYDLAVNMIKLSGLVPDKDIKIEEIGLRPGEKLYEELLMKNEKMTKTHNNKIFIEKDAPYTREQIEEKINTLKQAMNTAKDNIDFKKVFKQVVPTYKEAESVNRKATGTAEMKAAQ